MVKINLPRRFYWDHLERDLPTPEILQSNRAHIVVDAADPAMAEYLDDAEHYATGSMDMLPPGLRASAIATVAAIRKATTQTVIKDLAK